MEKTNYIVMLQPGTDEPEFLANEAAGMTVKSNLSNIDSIISMLLTEDEVNTLNESEKVIGIELPIQVEPTLYYSNPPVLERSAELITGSLPSGYQNLNGADFGGTQFYFTGNMNDDNITSSSGNVGYFNSSPENEDRRVSADIKQNFAGQFVDIVAMEAGTGSPLYDEYPTHPDFMLGSEASKLLGEAITIELTATADGTNNWVISGTDRATTHSNASDPAITMYPGDTLRITNGEGSMHPFEIQATDGMDISSALTNNGGYTGAAGGNVIVFEPTSAMTYEQATSLLVGIPGTNIRYICSNHSNMSGLLRVEYKRSRFVRMDWEDYDSALVSQQQITDNLDCFSSHAIGVLSAAGGTFNGWAKASSLRVIYTEDGLAEGYNAILQWHKTKAVNPVTGVRNATIVTGAYGYTNAENTEAVYINDIQSLTYYDADNNATTVNRPGGGWGTDLSVFIDNGIYPKVINDPNDSTDKWCVVWGLGGRYGTQFATTFNPLGPIWDSFTTDGSIYSFKSAGNYGNIFSRSDHPSWNTSVVIAAGSGLIEIERDTSQGYDTFDLQPGNSFSSATTRWPARSYSEGRPGTFTIGASQHSVANPLMDDYSSRGQGIDLCGMGANTWTANPIYSFNDGKYGYFSGTSCAAPQAAGVGACIIDEFFSQRFTYPSQDKFKELAVRKSLDIIADEELVDFENLPSAGNFNSDRLYSAGTVWRITQGRAANGGQDISIKAGTPPYRMNMDYTLLEGPAGKFIGQPRGTLNGRRPASGKLYPRPKIKVGT